MTELTILSNNLLDMALAPKTKISYSSAYNRYTSFCSSHHLTPIPPNEHTLVLYTSELSLTMAHSSIKVHMAAISYFSTRQGYPTEFRLFRRLYLVIRGIKRSQGSKFKRRKRDAVTPTMLMEIHSKLFSSSTIYEDKIMLWAALLTAFFGFLRVSEYTSARKTSFDPSTTLLYSDITHIDNNHASLLIKASKTDPFRQGVNITLAANHSTLCPINALLLLIHNHPTSNGPLFTYHNRRYLTRRDINNLLKDTTDGRLTLSSHSLRIGAASTAAAMGCPKWMIQGMGRWSSDCFRDYIRIPKRIIEKTSRAMAKCNITIEHFDPDCM